MSDRHMLDAQLYLFLQLFLTLKKLRIAYIQCESTLINNEPLSDIKYKKKIMQLV